MSYSMFTTGHNGKLVCVIVLHERSVERMKEADPAVLEGSLIALAFKKTVSPENQEAAERLPVSHLDVLIAYEPSQEEFDAKAKELRSSRELLKWLGRGWKDRPEDEGERERWEETHYSKGDVTE